MQGGDGGIFVEVCPNSAERGRHAVADAEGGGHAVANAEGGTEVGRNGAEGGRHAVAGAVRVGHAVIDDLLDGELRVRIRVGGEVLAVSIANVSGNVAEGVDERRPAEGRVANDITVEREAGDEGEVASMASGSRPRGWAL